MKYLLFSLLWIVSCTSFQTEKNLIQFNSAKKVNLAGDSGKAQKLWASLCKEKHKASCLLSGQKVSWHPGLAIMQGSSDDGSVNIVALKRKKEAHQYFAFDLQNKKVVEASKSFETTKGYSDWALKRFEFNRLIQGREYLFVVVSDYGELVDFRKFKTLASEKKNLKWALTSCMADHYDDEQKKQWLDVASFNPDVIFMIGDNVYVDWGRKKNINSKTIWKRHVQTRNNLEIFRQENLTPVFATWDDHDYGKNNADMNFEHKEESQKTFLQFFPMAKNKTVVSNGPGVSSSVEISNQLFLFMDNRSFRTPTKVKNIQSHFGDAQVKWAMDEIKKTQNPVWLVSGDQFFGGYHPFESFQGNHPKDFMSFLDLLKRKRNKVLFLSGDRHLSEIMVIPEKFLGYKTYELTSSGIHSTTYPGSFKKSPNPLASDFIDGEINYMIIESQKTQSGVKFHVKDFGLDKKLIFEKKLNVN